MPEPVEVGMLILKATNCRVGIHVWIFTGPAPAWPNDTCACGLIPWEKRDA